MGYLNCNLQSKYNVNVKALLNTTDIYGMEQLINEPTRITPTTIALIYFRCIFHLRVSHVAIGYHSLVYAYRKLLMPTFSKGVSLITYRQFKHFKYCKFLCGYLCPTLG